MRADEFAWHATPSTKSGTITLDGFAHWLRARPPASGSVPILCRRTAEWTPQACRERFPGVFVPAVYDSMSVGHFTVHGVPVNRLHELADAASASDVVEFMRGAVGSGADTLFSLSERAGAPQPYSRVVVGVVDTDIAYLHPQFRRPGALEHTRILALWDQNTLAAGDAAAGWTMPARFGYGRAIGRDQLDALLARGQPEAETYLAAGQRTWPRWGHGTQVLAMAAGLDDPLAGPAGLAAPGAAQADIVAVQLPRPVIAQTHGLWLNVRLLDALHFILDSAPSDAAVVVNLSLGSYLGPHDGSGLLEQAIKALIDKQAGRLTLVVAAGNGRGQRVRVRLEVPPAAADGKPGQADFAFDLPPEDPTPNIIGCWYDSAAPADPDPLRFRLQPPAGPPSDWVDAVTPVVGCLHKPTTQGPNLVALLAHQTVDLAGAKRRGAWVGLAPSELRNGMARAPTGRWQVQIENRAAVPMVVDAWLARDESLPGDGTPRRQLPLDGPLSDEGTLSNLAWVPAAVVVGAYEVDQQGRPVGMLPVSASAFEPARAHVSCHGPDIAAPGGGHGAAAGTWCRPMPFLSRDTSPARELAGTSLACAVVTRRIAHALQVRAPGAAPERAALLQWIRQAYPNVGGVRAPGQEHWTGEYWMGPATSVSTGAAGIVNVATSAPAARATT